MNTGDAGDIFAGAVTIADGWAAAGDDRPTYRQSSCELHICSSTRNKVTDMISEIVGLLYQLHWKLFKNVLTNAAVIIVRLWNCFFQTF